ncbi:MAG: hypothetical protein PHC34_08305 [Candidatus Gastranaerophilales bacterium]|nr:hypothetical protein [Candidatus Gastranaerophilales bacterium]
MSVQPTGLTLIKVNDSATEKPKYINASSISTIKQANDKVNLIGSDDKVLGVIDNSSTEDVLKRFEEENITVGKVLDLSA